MELQTNYHIFEKRPIVKDKTPAVRWFKEWLCLFSGFSAPAHLSSLPIHENISSKCFPTPVSDLGAPGGCFNWWKMLPLEMGYGSFESVSHLITIIEWQMNPKCSLKDDMLKALKEKHKEPEPEEPEPEPTTEVVFLCTYEGCGKTFTDAGALRKHSHIHGERQYVCTWEGCGRKFLDSSKLKRHNLIHTGERHFVCPHEGCGKAFSLDFNLRAHMRTHSQENYHICPYEDCGKRYAHEYKLKTHIKAHHEKNTAIDVIKQTPPSEKIHSTPKAPAVVYGSASSDRPYACPYEGCGKSYIHEYKLNLHLRREHPGHNAEENGKQTLDIDNNDMDEGSDQDAYTGKGSNGKNLKRSKPKPKVMPPSKMAKGSSLVPVTTNVPTQKQWPAKEMYEEDSEETEEDRENVEEDGWRYAENNEDDEETEYED